MKIRVNLSALTRVEWSGVVEVPDDTTEAEIEELTARVCDVVSGTEYTDDVDFWDESPGYSEPTDDDESPVFSLVDGKLTRE